ncbi:hypothetical protein [Candidatus Poriferisocius sp.]|uniref:hypothetical protein n=1 Tax=Candidatus Poriferisocius sp. TaxID=3101276 RepID=UPI003B5B60D9
MFFLVWGSASLLIFMVFVPWLAGVLNTDPGTTKLVSAAAIALIGALMIVSPSITRRVRERSAPVPRDQA